ncbi:MAG: DUF61 family protein [Crenarchaeota archaeon]|nr:DUF61 family protein [Thermoproteota archaeon]
MARGLADAIRARVEREKARLVALQPAELRTLYSIVNGGGRCIELLGGGVHCFAREEINELARIVPWYLYRLVKLPVIILYRREGYVPVFRVAGDKWACYLVGLVLEGRLWRCKRVLSEREVRRLIGRFKSVFLVTIELGEVGVHGRGVEADAGAARGY